MGFSLDPTKGIREMFAAMAEVSKLGTPLTYAAEDIRADDVFYASGRACQVITTEREADQIVIFAKDMDGLGSLEWRVAPDASLSAVTRPVA